MTTSGPGEPAVLYIKTHPDPIVRKYYEVATELISAQEGLIKMFKDLNAPFLRDYDEDPEDFKEYNEE